jgi:hypothetical protein
MRIFWGELCQKTGDEERNGSNQRAIDRLNRPEELEKVACKVVMRVVSQELYLVIQPVGGFLYSLPCKTATPLSRWPLFSVSLR